MTDLISKKTRQAFREHLVGLVLRQISDEFDAVGVRCDLDYQPPVSGQRRALVEQYFHTVSWDNWNEVRKVVQAFENIVQSALHRAEDLDVSDKETAGRLRTEAHKLIDWMKKDGFEWGGGRFVRAGGGPSLNDIKQTAREFDASHLAEQIARIEQSIEDDPALAVGTAKELVETCCKTILAERGKPVEGMPDIPTLTKQTLKELRLVPDGIPNEAKGAETIKRMLSNLATITQGLAELRSLYGTGHGKHGKTQSIKPRHAKLAVGAAATLATFLFETHKEVGS